MGRWWNIRGGDWGEQGGWTEKRGDWGRERRDWEDDQLDMHRRQSLPTPLADVFSCQWCGKPSEHEQWRPQFCTQTVRSCWTSNGIPDGGTNPGVRYIQIFRYSDIQIYSDIFSVKKLKRERSWYIGYAPAPPVSVTCHQSPDSSAF